jgi:glycine/D-amino acid oxidase-like deaminating enzyme
MDIKSGSCLWPDLNRAVPSYPRLDKDIRCEVAVVGAGLTGALSAYSLTQAGFEVVLFDKRDVAGGSTSASTALILYEIDVPLTALIRKIGKQSAVRGYQLCRDAIFQIEDTVAQLGDDCGFARMQSLYLASRKADVIQIKRELQARQEVGFDVGYISPSELSSRFSLRAPGGLLSREAAQIDPYRFAHRLVENGIAGGMRVFGGTEVDECDDSRRNVIIRTKEKHTVSAKWVIMATGFESRLPLKRKLVQLKSTFALASAPAPHLPPVYQSLLLWETARPYIYFRTTPDGRILLGGGDEDFCDAERRDQLIPQKTRWLQQRLKQLLPDLRTETEYAWAGIFGDTKDGLPYIGSARGHPKIVHALCYGANGTNFAMLAANLITDKFRGRRNRDAQILSLYR